MIVYDVIVNGKVQEIIKPINQGIPEIYWFMVDKMEELKRKYGNQVSVKRRFEVQ